jgi:hypothetical protein
VNRAEQRERTSKLVTELHSIAKLGAKRILLSLLILDEPVTQHRQPGTRALQRILDVEDVFLRLSMRLVDQKTGEDLEAKERLEQREAGE